MRRAEDIAPLTTLPLVEERARVVPQGDVRVRRDVVGVALHRSERRVLGELSRAAGRGVVAEEGCQPLQLARKVGAEVRVVEQRAVRRITLLPPGGQVEDDVTQGHRRVLAFVVYPRA